MDALVLISVSYLLNSFHGSSTTSFGPSCTCEGKGGCVSTYQCEPPLSCRKENIALGKEASFTTVWMEDYYPACLALNGNTSRTYARINTTNPNCANSGDKVTSAWQVDLGKVYAINSITIYTMKWYEIQMSGVVITVDNNYCNDISTTKEQELFDLECKAPLRGRFIKFLKPTPSKYGQFLSFCEVQVWACISGYYGRNCENSCGKCINRSTACDPFTGNCSSGCQIGWQPPLCKENSLAPDPLGIFNWSLIGVMICGFVALCIMLSVIIVLYRKLSRHRSQSADNCRSTDLALQPASTMQTLEDGQLRRGNNCGNIYDSTQREDQSAEYCYTSFISDEIKSQPDWDDQIYANVVAT